MKLYFAYFSEQAKVHHLSVDGQVITAGALVELGTQYQPDMDRFRLKSLEGLKYRVLSVKALPYAYRERLGIEMDRKAHNEILAGKERWYAAVELAAVLTKEDGSVRMIDKSPCEPFLEVYLRCSVPAHTLRVLEPGNGQAPVGGVDYSISPYEHLYPKYQAINQEFEGYSNRPTACLGLMLIQSEAIRRQLRGAVTSKGVVTEAKLMQLSRREGWVSKAVPDEAFVTDPFPPHAPYREEINYQEIATEITRLHQQGAL